jgi:hypothetical protein
MIRAASGSQAYDWDPSDLLDGIRNDDAASPHTLCWLARTFELAQRERIRRGERIRAIAQARDLSWGGDAGPLDGDADELLRRIERGDALGPVPFLGVLYQRAWAEERQLSTLLEETVTMHVAWPWLMQIRGVGPRLAARLLSRLRIDRARSPSAFWSYCGLGTVPAAEYRCESCGTRVLVPEKYSAPGRHLANGRIACTGRLVRRRGGRPRVAQPRSRRLEARRYDAAAKTICFLVGTSFSRQGGPYKTYYKDAYARYEGRHPEWPAKHVVYAAMRLTVKLFLKHLWIVWREAERMPTEFVDPFTAFGGVPGPGPWEMVSPPSAEKVRAAERLARKNGTKVVRRGRPPGNASAAANTPGSESD